MASKKLISIAIVYSFNLILNFNTLHSIFIWISNFFYNTVFYNNFFYNIFFLRLFL